MNEDGLKELQVQLTAIQVCVFALMRSHPRPQRLREELARKMEVAEAKVLNFPWTEEELDRFRAVMAAAARQIPPR